MEHKHYNNMDYSQFLVGRSHGRTMHGVSNSLLKSALQKYVRRSETEKAVGCLYETNTLILLENAGADETAFFQKENKQKSLTQKSLNQYGKAQRTNMANRLLVMCSEEVNIHDHPLIPVYVWRLYNRWQQERNQEESVKHLAQAATILANAKKGRLLSYLKSAFNLPPYYVKESDRAQYNEFHATRVLAHFEDVDVRSACARYDIETFKACVQAKEVEKAFRCIGTMCATMTPAEIKALFKEIWTYVRKVAYGNRSVQALYEMYTKMTHQERPLYLYHALLLYMRHTELAWDAPMAVPPIPSAKAIHHSIRDDAYVCDHHVSGAKGLGSYVRLLKESFFVPESHHVRSFVMADYEALYRYIKLAMGHFEEHRTFPTDETIQTYIEEHFEPRKESVKEFSHMPLAQRRTGKNKKFVRVDFDLKRIIKGPYRTNEPAYRNAIKFNKALLLLDANTGAKTAWEWTAVHCDGDDRYLIAPFVSENCSPALTVRNVESWKGGATYDCFERDSKVLGWRIKDLLDEGKLTDGGVKQAVMQHFYLRYLLGVGDTNVGNIMLVEHSKTDQLVAGLDLEEIRSKYDTSSAYKLIVGSDVKKQRAIFEPYLGSIVRVDWGTLTDEFGSLFSEQEMTEMQQRDALLNKKFVK